MSFRLSCRPKPFIVLSLKPIHLPIAEPPSESQRLPSSQAPLLRRRPPELEGLMLIMIKLL